MIKEIWDICMTTAAANSDELHKELAWPYAGVANFISMFVLPIMVVIVIWVIACIMYKFLTIILPEISHSIKRK